MEIADDDELVRRLNGLIARAGSTYPAVTLLADISAANRDIRTDESAHEVPAGPFFNFTIWRGAAVFAIYDDRLELYVLPCDPIAESSLITAFSPLAMVDVTRGRQVLADKYDRTTPDLILTPDLTARVLAGDSTSNNG